MAMNIIRGNGNIQDGTNIAGRTLENVKAGRNVDVAKQMTDEDRAFIKKNATNPKLIKAYRPFCKRCHCIETQLRIETEPEDYKRMKFVERQPIRQKNRITGVSEVVGVEFVFKCPHRNCGTTFMFENSEFSEDEECWEIKPPVHLSEQLQETIVATPTTITNKTGE